MRASPHDLASGFSIQSLSSNLTRSDVIGRLRIMEMLHKLSSSVDEIVECVCVGGSFELLATVRRCDDKWTGPGSIQFDRWKRARVAQRQYTFNLHTALFTQRATNMSSCAAGTAAGAVATSPAHLP